MTLCEMVHIAMTLVFFAIMVLVFIANKRRVTRVICAIAFIVVAYLMSYPIENTFMSFSTIEALAAYSMEGDVEFVEHGINSSLVLTRRGDETYQHVVEKKGGGWKIKENKPLDFSYRSREGEYYVQVVTAYEDTYIIIDAFENNESREDIFTTVNGEVFREKKIGTHGSLSVMYCFVEDEFAKPYYINKNGESFICVE